MTNKNVGILGIGSYLPEKVLKNADLEKLVDTSDEWIVKRTGVSERRILEDNQPAFEMGVKASLAAIEQAGITPEEIDLIITATVSPDYIYPQTACLIQARIGAKNAAAFDINAACSGFIYAMTTAEKFIQSGAYKYVLVVGCEGLSRTVDWQDRNTCIIFGDGSGAALLGAVEDGFGILSTHLAADGDIDRVVTLPFCFSDDKDKSVRAHDNKNVIWMDGQEVFKFAVRVLADATEKVIAKAGLTMDDVKLVIPHQANIRIIEGGAKRLGIKLEKMFSNIKKYGNISSASIPVALVEAVSEGLIKKGDNLVFVGFGGGLTWGSLLLKWAK
jgi:3-oxoacyl-[acyl-carrier-protein] synthase-3